MFLKFFKQTLPQVIIVLLLLGVIMWLKGFWSESTPFYFDSIKMPFYSIVTNWFQENSLYGKLLSLLTMLFTAFFLLQINSKHIIIKQRSYLPAFFYILLASCIISLQRINPAVFSALLFVVVFDNILSIYHKENVLDNIFRAGFFIALASLFYAPSILYFFVLLISIVSIRTFNVREWFAALFGVITPWFFYFLYTYFINNDLRIAYKTILLNLFTQVNQENDGVLIYVLFVFCILLFLITGFYLINTLPTQKISVRKYHGIFFWFNMVTIVAFVFIPSISVEIILIAVIPITFQFTHYFTTTKGKFWPELFFLLLIVIAVLMQFY